MTLKRSTRCFAIFSAALSACQPDPHAGRKPVISDAALSKVRNQLPGITEDCLDKIKYGEDLPRLESQCFQMSPTTHMRGLWQDDFEGQFFCAFPAKVCASSETGDRTCIEFSVKALRHARLGGLYAIDFIGRRSVRRGYYGMGGNHEVVVDRIISIKMLDPPPPAPSEAELVSYWRKCQAAGTCFPSREMRKVMKDSNGH